MQFEIKDPKRIRQLLAMGVTNSPVMVSTEDTRAAAPQGTYVVRNKVDLAIVANYFGIDMASGRGRPPRERVRQAVERHGSRLDDSGYESSTESSERRYLVTALVRTGNRIQPTQVEITAGEVRGFVKSRAGKRGRLSRSHIVDAAKALYEWEGTIIDDSVTVESLH